jgi:hypothetical protein
VDNLFISVILSRKLVGLLGGANNDLVKRVKYYPIILIITYLPISICRVIQEFDESLLGVDLIAYIFHYLEGFFDFLVFINHQDIRFIFQKIKDRFYRYSYGNFIN